MLTGLKAARAIRLYRDGGQDTSELLYRAYLLLLTLLMLGVPVLISLATKLAAPEAMAVLSAPDTPKKLWLLFGACGAGAFLLGGTRGPVMRSPFLTFLYADSPLPRRRTQLVPFAASALSLIFAAALLASPFAWALGNYLICLYAVACATVLSALWLAGQASMPRRARLAVLAACALIALLGYLDAIGAAALAGIALPALAAMPSLLDRLRASVLLAQASRWDAASMAAATGDLSAAAGRFRPVPVTGRGLPAVANLPLPLGARLVLRDAVASLRTPLRLLAALGAVALASRLLPKHLSLTVGPEGILGLIWPLAPVVASACLLLIAAGAFCDPLRAVVEGLGVPKLYGPGPLALFAWHLVWPLLLIFGCALAAGGVRPALLAAMLFLVRARDLLRGDMPAEMLVPAPTAGMDMQGVAVFAWVAQAYLLASVMAVGFLLAAGTERFGGWAAPVLALAYFVSSGFAVPRAMKRLRN
ncbi:hypothetical protein ACUIAC_02710 [Dermabacteraceae bacterium P13138]